MSIDIMSAVWKCGPTNSTERFVLLSIADRADERGYCYPSYKDIAGRCAISRTTAVNTMKRLKDAGWIRTRSRKKNDGSRTSNGIYINLEKLVDAEMAAEKETKTAATGGTNSGRGVVQNPAGGGTNSGRGVVQNPAGGGTNSVPESSYNHQLEPSSNPAGADDPVAILAGHFERRLGYPAPSPQSTMYQEKWRPILAAILEHTGGDMARAEAIVDASFEFARGRGPGSSDKTYPVANPFSLRTIWRNQAARLETVTDAGDNETIWSRAVAAITNGDFSDNRLKTAIREIGGSNRIRGANSHDTDMLRRLLGDAYRNTATV